MKFTRVLGVAALAALAVCSAETTTKCAVREVTYSERPIIGLQEAAASGLTAMQCIDKCAESPTCLAFHWTPQGACKTYATVYSKYSSLGFDYGGPTFSELPASGAIIGRCHRNGPDQVKGGFKGFEQTMKWTAATPDICSYLCDGSTTECEVYTWTDENGGTCYITTSHEAVVPAPWDISAVSGEVLRCRTQVDVDVVGADLAQVSPRPDWRSCWGECRRTDGCKATTWSSENGGTCSLKKNFTTRAAHKGSITNVPLPGRWIYGYF